VIDNYLWTSVVNYSVTKYILNADYLTSGSEFDIFSRRLTLFEITVEVNFTCLIQGSNKILLHNI